MLVPTNSAAKTIEKLTNENVGYEQQIVTLTSWVEENNTIIADMQDIATWEEVIDPVPVVEEGTAPVSDNPGMLA